MSVNGNGFWKTAAITVMGMFLTGATAWFTMAQDVVTESELQIISPYVQDRALIHDYIEEIRALRSEVRELTRSVQRLEAQLEP